MNAVEQQGALFADNEEGLALDLATTDRLADLFTRRLRRLVSIRREHSGRMNGQGLRLLDRTIYATYCDCLDLGIGAEGLRLLHTEAAAAT
jgi:hypothetical protein